ncbi:MAG: HD domain-containing protein [Oscillospiraceae bacterium]|nr:HD domain-containing protein [Oscillospiraceae bacterium]
MPSVDNVPIRLRSIPLDIYLECKVYSKKPANDTDSDALTTPDEEEFSLLCENQFITKALIERLKRTVFPASKVYIPRQSLITNLFDKGHMVGYSEQEAEEIRNGGNPWSTSSSPSVNLSAINVKKAAPAKKPAPKPESNANFFKEKFRIKRFGEVINLYNKTKDITEDMVRMVSVDGKIDRERSAEITNDVQTQVNTTDVSLIVQTINQIRTADQYLHTHCLNVAFLNGLMGRWMMYDAVRQNELVETGLFHDIGKLSLPKEILNKPGELTPEEFQEVKRHPILSSEILMKSGMRNKAVLEGVVQHHERINGTGYPNGLDLKKICEYARITAISDTYDAMVTKRFHDDAHSPFVILNEFSRSEYSEFDIRYVNIFINCMVDELQGKEIIMNDGREAVVLLVDPRRLLYPIVEIDGKVVSTDEHFYCIRMKNVLE